MGLGLLARGWAREAKGQRKRSATASPLAEDAGKGRSQPMAKLVPQPQEEVAFGFSTAK